jgi:hypothetical protein
MPVDVRAQVFSNLGPVISGQLSDDPLQPGVGLLRTTGEVTISGLIQPTRGTELKLGMVLPGGKLTRFPRRLRVLKAESDPYENQTVLQVGCLLAMKWDLVQKEVYRAIDYPQWSQNYDSPFYNQNETYIQSNINGSPTLITLPKIPIPQVCMLPNVVAVCLARCEITAATGNPEIRAAKARAGIDLSSGYLEVAGRIISESGMYGFINADEKLRLRKLLEPTTRGPVMALDDMITMEAIGDPAPPVELNISYSGMYYGPTTFVPPNAATKAIQDWSKPIQWGNGG